MVRLHQLSLETQIKRLRNAAIACLFAGGYVSYCLQANHHKMWAFIVFIITLQAAIGSAIIMFDLKRDLQARKVPLKD